MKRYSAGNLLIIGITFIATTGCQHVACGPHTFAVHEDGRGHYIDQDGRGHYVDQDGRQIRRVVCATVTPPTVCGVGTVRVDHPSGYLIDPDGRGFYVDQDGRGHYVDQDQTIAAARACVLGELHEEIDIGT